MAKPGQIKRGEQLEALTTALDQIESGRVAFPKGGKRKAIARIKEKIAKLEASGAKIPSYEPTQGVSSLRRDRIAA